MKVSISQDKEEFKPVKFTFTCESLDDVKFLWHRFNASWDDVYDCSYFPLEKYSYEDSHSYWETIDKFLEGLQ